MVDDARQAIENGTFFELKEKVMSSYYAGEPDPQGLATLAV